MTIGNHTDGDALSARLQDVRMTSYERVAAQAQLDRAMALAEFGIRAASWLRGIGRRLAMMVVHKRDYAKNGVLHSD